MTVTRKVLVMGKITNQTTSPLKEAVSKVYSF